MTETQAVYRTGEKTWDCKKCGKPLGTIDRKNGIHRLSMPDRGIFATGRIDVTCLNCGAVREWFADAEAMKRLLESHGKKYDY
jgi:RNase P subunit RPR2